ncbi:MAG TPA: PfkB family carbohydrate kinase [Candidatus Limnocylindria bacterium]|nr:PfkB family carbohydrate kinase [Candidatus Limnocylindria bacterium]
MNPAVPAQKRILIVQDISCVGRCSTLVALPVLSSGGHACALLPTALLSAHTGGFGDVYRRDLGADMEGILAHWRGIGLRFDAVYVGYAGSAEQLWMVEQALPSIMLPGARLYVDPVMGDHGRAYRFITPDMVAAFRSLCAKASVIFPNRTETALLLGVPLRPGEEPAMPEPGALGALGAGSAVLTGVTDGAGGIGVWAQHGEGVGYTTFRRRYAGSWPGTGDLFASAAIAALEAGVSLPQACELSCDFLDASFRHTLEVGTETRHGLAFEPGLVRLGAEIAKVRGEGPCA